MHAERVKHIRAHTKIVATVGPVSRSPEMLAALMEAGVDVFRLNMAHGEIAQHEEVVKTIRRLSDEMKQPTALLVDLAGPKIRLGELIDGAVECEMGAEFRFIRGHESKEPRHLTCTYDKLIEELHVGDRIMLADGTVSMLVEEKSREAAKCRCIQAGVIRSRQGVNLPGVKVSLPAMSDEDKQHAVWACQAGVDYISLSFVRSPKEVNELKWLVNFQRSSARVIAKIEKQEALTTWRRSSRRPTG